MKILKPKNLFFLILCIIFGAMIIIRASEIACIIGVIGLIICGLKLAAELFDN